jgi:hypothetical protein
LFGEPNSYTRKQAQNIYYYYNQQQQTVAISPTAQVKVHFEKEVIYEKKKQEAITPSTNRTMSHLLGKHLQLYLLSVIKYS